VIICISDGHIMTNEEGMDTEVNCFAHVKQCDTFVHF